MHLSQSPVFTMIEAVCVGVWALSVVASELRQHSALAFPASSLVCRSVETSHHVRPRPHNASRCIASHCHSGKTHCMPYLHCVEGMHIVAVASALNLAVVPLLVVITKPWQRSAHHPARFFDLLKRFNGICHILCEKTQRQRTAAHRTNGASL